MEQLRFQPGDLAICTVADSRYQQNNGIIVKIEFRVDVDDISQDILDDSPPGDVFWWVKSFGVPLRYRAKKNLVKRMEGMAHDSALKRLCGAPTKQLEEVA